jgi:hypothetical protein
VLGEKEPEVHDDGDFETPEHAGLQAELGGIERIEGNLEAASGSGLEGGAGGGRKRGGEAVLVQQERPEEKVEEQVEREEEAVPAKQEGPAFKPAQNPNTDERLPDILCQAFLTTLEKPSYIERVTMTLEIRDLLCPGW